MNRNENTDHLDRQVKHLADRMRESGTAPSRDLWPEIDAALDKVEQPVERPKDQDQSSAGRPLRTWRLAALAATLALILGLGYLGHMDQPPQGPSLDRNLAMGQGVVDVAAADPEPISALKKLDNTLHELNDALSLDPDNRNLSRLVLLVHKSRADILRQNTEGLSSFSL